MSKQIKKAGFLAVSLMALSQGTAMAGSTPALPSMVPSNPAAGECYARVEIPAKMQTRTEQVMVHEGYTDYQVAQPTISPRQQQVMTKEASTEYRVRQPQYRTMTEQMMVRPAYEKLQVTPPQFQTVTESMQVSAPRMIWKKGNPGQLAAQGYIVHSTADAGPSGQGYGSTVQYGAARSADTHCGDTCEIWCLVEEPGQTVQFNRRVMTTPSMVQRVPVPAKYQSITKQVLADPGGVEEIPVPAQYTSVMVEDVMPARASAGVQVPPKFDQVVVNIPVENERWEWRRVVCETGTHPSPNATLPSAQTSAYTGPTYTAPATAPTYNSGYSSGSTYTAPSGYSSGYSSGTVQSYGGGHNTMNYEGVCRKGDTRHECVSGPTSRYEGVSSGHHNGATSGYNQNYSHGSTQGSTQGYPQQGYNQYESGGAYQQPTQQTGDSYYDKATGYYQKANDAHDAYETVRREKKRWRR